MKQNRRIIVFLNSLVTGFFGGILIASIHLGFYYFNINKVSHRTILQFFYIDGEWLTKWYGYLFFILFIALLSMVVAIIYYLLCKTIKGWLIGAIFGILLWIVYGLLIPIFYYDIAIKKLFYSYGSVATICLSIIYGMFIGYSISYDYETSEQFNDNDKTN